VEFFISASAGVALYPQDGADVETLIKSADIAMYDAKAQGKNQYLLCSWAVKDQAPEE
jgi:GGDEF domain-containing protein